VYRPDGQALYLPNFMDPYVVLIYLSLIVILSYLFNIIVKKFKIPSVLLLLATGMLFRYISSYYDIAIPNTKGFLSFLGIVGLILIVLEGALDLKLSRDKAGVIKKSLSAAALILVSSSLLLAFLIQWLTGAPFQHCLVNAVPLAVISSAITIPSVENLGLEKREFLIYESTFSDILGIMLFNYIVLNDTISVGSVFQFGTDFVLVLAISVVSCMVLLFLLGKLKYHVKFFLILAVLMLAYALGKLFHLSTLLLVLVFGLVINNSKLFIRGPLAKYIDTGDLKQDLRELKLVTAESAFLIRTFFFILFGLSIDLDSLTEVSVLFTGFIIVDAILLVRYLHLKYVARQSLIPELFIAPRGLITILLFYSIPEKFIIPTFSEGILLVVVVLTGLLMMFGLLITDKKVELEEVEDLHEVH
jgi:Kef-type K+ transport system membrane component KefB